MKLVNVEELKDILTSPDVGDAKILILTIVGETRAGKSTLLNIIYRYLACQVSERSLLDTEDKRWTPVVLVSLKTHLTAK